MCLYRLKNFWSVFWKSINSSRAYTVRVYRPGRKNLLLEFYWCYDYHSKFFKKLEKCTLKYSILFRCTMYFLCVKNFRITSPEVNELKWAIHNSHLCSGEKIISEFYWCYDYHSKLFWKLKRSSLNCCNLFSCAMYVFAMKNFLSVSSESILCLRVQYRSKISWQSLEPQSSSLETRYSILESVEYRVSRIEYRVASRES